MPDPLFAQGTTATIKDESSGSPTSLTDLIDIGANTRAKTMARVDGIGDTEEKFKPVEKVNKGTVTFVFHQTDETLATNQRKTLETKWTNSQKVTITPNFPGAFDASTPLNSWTGYIESIEDNGAQRDGTDPLRYTVTLRVTS